MASSDVPQAPTEIQAHDSTLSFVSGSQTNVYFNFGRPRGQPPSPGPSPDLERENREFLPSLCLTITDRPPKRDRGAGAAVSR
jgi:hypothetical protein